ncbi:hypothetical protein Tco_0739688 [Tanacetum coccineum]
MVFFGRISPNSFLSSILLLVVIIVMVVFVVVILVVVAPMKASISWVYAFHQDKASSVKKGLIADKSLWFPFSWRSSSKIGVPVGIIDIAMTASCFQGAVELDNVVGEEDKEWICFLCGTSSSGTKKYRGSNSSDGDNIGDGVKIDGEVIGSGDEIDENNGGIIFSLEFSEELKEMLPDEAGK